jgi:hypothetical protein
MFKHVISISVALTLLMVIGCSKVPETELTATDNAIQAAVKAEADKYAPAEYQMAMDTLNAAKAAIEEQKSKFALFRSYDKSRKLLEASQKFADDAAAQAVTGKEQVQKEVTAMMAQADTLITKAGTALKNAPRGKGSNADLALIKNDLAAAQATQTDAVNDFKNGDFLSAKAKFQAAITKAENIINEIGTAKSRTSK